MSEIRLKVSAYENNIKNIAAKIGGVEKILLVLKDNAYGHGVKIIAPIARDLGIKYVAVKNEREAYEIRPFFEKILILSHIPHGDEDNDFYYAINDIRDFAKLKTDTKVVLAIDTGMRRNGLLMDEVEDGVRLCREMKLNLRGAYTHFYAADSDDGSYEKQKELFKQAKKIVSETARHYGFYDVKFHSQNSAALERESEFDDDYVRIGIAQYGYSQFNNNLNLQKVMSLWASRVSMRDLAKGESVGYGGKFVAEDELEIATYDLGYGDGLLRYNGKGELSLANGGKLLGKMSMDSFSTQNYGKEVCVFDDAEVWAKFFDTISYEILVKLSPEIKRILV